MARCIADGLVSGQRFAADASLIEADENKQNSTPKEDWDHGVIVDVEAIRLIRQAEVGSARTMLDRVKDTFNLHPERVIADTAYGSGPMLGWLVDRKIAPHIPVIHCPAVHFYMHERRQSWTQGWYLEPRRF